MQQDLGPLLNAIYPKVVATLVRVLGDLDRAMDASQDALVKALQSWQKNGVPENPVAWLVTVGRNGAIDQIRREQRLVSLDSNVVSIREDTFADDSVQIEELDWLDVDDDLLRLVFTCCHPSLNPQAQIALVLKVVLGFSVEEIARGLLASPASIEKRITRAKKKIRDEEIAYEVPGVNEIPARLAAVLKTVYLLFNEGYTRIQDDNLVRGSLIDVAIRLARITSRLFRDNPEPRALLALMLLSAARLPGRVNDKVFVPLVEQDRMSWNQAMIREGIALVDAIHVARHPPGAYQIQAAISALHSQAPSSEETDWPQIAALYEKLEQYDASPVVPVNRAVAMSFCGQAAAALDILMSEPLVEQLMNYQPYFAALGHVYERLGDVERAREQLSLALELAQSPPQRRYLEQQIADLKIRLSDGKPTPR